MFGLPRHSPSTDRPTRAILVAANRIGAVRPLRLSMKASWAEQCCDDLNAQTQGRVNRQAGVHADRWAPPHTRNFTFHDLYSSTPSR